MFGYIVINKDELKIKDYNMYRSFYCGLCQELKNDFGRTGQISLSYDMTFIILLLTALYEEETAKSTCKCVAHPFEKHPVSRNCFTSYAADMNLILTYYKCLDDWADEKKGSRRIYASTLKSKMARLEKKYPKKIRIISENLQAITDYERSGETDLDIVAGYFGNIMAAIFTCKEDEWSETLQEMGFFFGKFIYLMDAYDDLEQDKKKGNYNPFLSMSAEPDFEEKAWHILTMMMANCCRAFERLPILSYTDILRNILYSGVWTRYNLLKQKKPENKNNQERSKEQIKEEQNNGQSL